MAVVVNIVLLLGNERQTDKASMLDEIIDYVKFLQLQVKVKISASLLLSLSLLIYVHYH